MEAKKYPVRKNPRMCFYDYTTPNYYFITICTFEKQCIFGEAGKLNLFGQIAERGLQEIPSHFDGTLLDKYVVMPNHIHAIIGLEPGNPGIPTIIGQYKSFVTKEIRKIAPNMKVWQTSFHDHVIRNQKGYETIWQYIDENPIKWNADCFFGL